MKCLIYIPIITLFLAALPPGISAAASADPAKPMAVLVVPDVKGVKVEWVLHPPEEKEGAALSRKMRTFDIDKDGHPWFGDGPKRLLTDAAKNTALLTSIPFTDFMFLDNGGQLICTDKYVAMLNIGDKMWKQENGIPVFQLRSLVQLSHPGCRLFHGGPHAFYILVHNDETGEDDLTLVTSVPGKQAERIKILSSKPHITAVAGDGQDTYIAVKNWILSLAVGETKPKPYYLPLEGKSVTGLAYASGGGLFYTTEVSVGIAADGYKAQLVKTESPQIVLRAGDLYVRMNRGFSVIKIGNAKLLKDLQPVKEPPDSKP